MLTYPSNNCVDLFWQMIVLRQFNYIDREIEIGVYKTNKQPRNQYANIKQ